jgi:hypothetical protein
MITIGKAHFRETCATGFESPSGRGTTGSLPVSLNPPLRAIEAVSLS